VDAGLLDAAREATKKVLYEEFHEAIADAREAYARDLDNGELDRLFLAALQITTARAFEDKLGWGPRRRGRSLTSLLAEVNQQAAGMLPTEAAAGLPDRVAERLLERLTNRVTFTSATPDMLSMIYLEPALDPAERRVLGAYYTSTPVTQYIFSVLPVSETDPRQWYVVDPTCGSGNLLVAAYHALWDALPEQSDAQKRVLLRKKGHGIDSDPVACEASRAAMLLCSVPAVSGWDITQADFFARSPADLGARRRPTILVANPPFGPGGGLRERAAGALARSIQWLADGGLLAVIVPETFSQKSSCTAARADLLDKCEVFDILRLPRDIFLKSRAATQVICARKRRPRRGRHAWVKTVSIADKRHFKDHGPGGITRAFRYPLRAWRASPGKSLTGSHLFEIWEEVRRLDFPSLRDSFQVRRGFEFKKGAKREYLLAEPLPDSHPCICSAHRLAQFRLTGPDEYVLFEQGAKSTAQRAHLQHDKAILCRTTTAADPWRLRAAYEDRGRLIYKSFLYATPKGPESSWLAVALLNSKLINAWFYSFNPSRDVLVKAVESIPWPRLAANDASRLRRLAQQLQGLDGTRDRAGRTRLAAEVDELVYDALKVGPAGRELIEELFFGTDRPGLGPQRPPAAFEGRILGKRNGRGRLLQMVGRVAYVDRDDRLVYCDLRPVVPERPAAFPLESFPPKLSIAGLTFEALVCQAPDRNVYMTEPQSVEFEGITYGEAYRKAASAS
jgi:hypothetical protein